MRRLRALIALLMLSVRAVDAAGIEETASDTAAAMERQAAPMTPGLSPAEAGQRQDRSGRHYVFISSSIPQASLLELARDAAARRIPMVLRGLVGDSMQETLIRMRPVSSTGAALEIDPTLFQFYKIEQVPAVVRTCGDVENRHAVVYGVTPSKALPRLEKMLPCAP